MLLIFLIPPRGPFEREEEHAIRYYSGGFGQKFLAITSALGPVQRLGGGGDVTFFSPLWEEAARKYIGHPEHI